MSKYRQRGYSGMGITKNWILDDDCQIDELIVRRGAMNKEYPHVLIEIMELNHV